MIYTSDQGFMLGEHDYIDKRWMYEESMRMPLLVRYPGAVKPGSRTDALINNTDFAPTILDLAQSRPPADMQGRSFLQIFQGSEPGDWRTATYYRYWMHMAHHDNPAHYGIRTKFKLIFSYGLPLGAPGAHRNPTQPGCELYDLRKDPSENENVYGRPGYLARDRQKTEIGAASLEARKRRYGRALSRTDGGSAKVLGHDLMFANCGMGSKPPRMVSVRSILHVTQTIFCRNYDKRCALAEGFKRPSHPGYSADRGSLHVPVTEKRLLKALKKHGDKAVIHGLRVKPSNSRIEEETREAAVTILGQDVYRGFGPTLASEYLANKHDIWVSREMVRDGCEKRGGGERGDSGWRKCIYTGPGVAGAANWSISNMSSPIQTRLCQEDISTSRH